MRLEDPGAKLKRLHEAAERISANLVELEIDSSRQLLEASALVGESALRWSTASAALTELWRRHGLLEASLERADKLRGTRRADELSSLLDGPSIELARVDVPLSERTLLGSSQTTDRCSPDELIAGMSAAFDEVKTVVAQIGTAWETLIPKLDGARRRLQEIKLLADELGNAGQREVDPATRALDTLSTRVTRDPLSVVPTDLLCA